MKRILLVNRPGGAFGYITDSWINALKDRGHNVQRWDGLESSWHEFNPDLYIGCSGHKQQIPTKRNSKIAIHVNPYGPTNIAGINENDNTIRWVCGQKPDVVFGYGMEEDRLLWSYWTLQKGIKWVPMPVAGDKVLYKATPEEGKTTDIVYLGGRWAYKGLTIDKYLLPLYARCLSGITDGDRDLRFRLCGWGEWPKSYNIEMLGEDKVVEFLGSGRVGPCISEQHTHEYGIDVPERAFKVALCNTLVVHDAVPIIRRMIPSSIIANSPENFQELCIYYSKDCNSEERIRLSQSQRHEVLSHHTYHHRMATLFEGIGWFDEANNMLRD